MSQQNLKSDLIEFLSNHPAHVHAIQAFEGLIIENRYKKVENFSHTIWEELEHLRISQEDILNYMFDSAWISPKWPDNYWPVINEKISNEQWEKTINGFLGDLQTIKDFVNNSQNTLTEKIPHAKEHSYLREILLIIDHNAYHLGKIVEMRKALNNW